MKKYLFKLYVAGQTPGAEQAIAKVRRICEREFCDQYELEIIDVLKDPQLAEAEKIFATPTLVKKLPQPCCRILGDLSNTEKVLSGLNLTHYDDEVLDIK